VAHFSERAGEYAGKILFLLKSVYGQMTSGRERAAGEYAGKILFLLKSPLIYGLKTSGRELAAT
jgi:hypothetical protein